MDELERFISSNREEIGHSKPSPEIWQKIEGQMGKEVRMVPLRRVWQAAAAVAVLLTSFFGWKLYNLEQQVAPAQASIDWKTIAPELAAAEQYYIQEISQKKTLLHQYDPQKYGIDPVALESEISHLDSVYQQMGKDLLESQQDERVVGAMIENLQFRIEILNRQLHILEQLQRLQKVEEVSTDI